MLYYHISLSCERGMEGTVAKRRRAGDTPLAGDPIERLRTAQSKRHLPSWPDMGW
jgi:hypothetical protein